MAKILDVSSSTREEFLDLTPKIQKIILSEQWQNGAVFLFCLHTTCGLTINENADPDVKKDLQRFFSEIAPHSHDWAHREGNSDAHIRSSLYGVSLLVPVQNTKLLLGQWQSIYLVEGDGPRKRQIVIQFFHE